MVRFARAEGSQASNKRVQEKATPWAEMIVKPDDKTSKKRKPETPAKGESDGGEWKNISKCSNLKEGGVDGAEVMKKKVKRELKPKTKMMDDTKGNTNHGMEKVDFSTEQKTLQSKKNQGEERTYKKKRNMKNKVRVPEKPKVEFTLNNKGKRVKVFKDGTERTWFDLPYEENERMTRFENMWVKTEMASKLMELKYTLDKQAFRPKEIMKKMMKAKRKAHRELRIELIYEQKRLVTDQQGEDNCRKGQGAKKKKEKKTCNTTQKIRTGTNDVSQKHIDSSIKEEESKIYDSPQMESESHHKKFTTKTRGKGNQETSKRSTHAMFEEESDEESVVKYDDNNELTRTVRKVNQETSVNKNNISEDEDDDESVVKYDDIKELTTTTEKGNEETGKINNNIIFEDESNKECVVKYDDKKELTKTIGQVNRETGKKRIIFEDEDDEESVVKHDDRETIKKHEMRGHEAQPLQIELRTVQTIGEHELGGHEPQSFSNTENRGFYKDKYDNLKNKKNTADYEFHENGVMTYYDGFWVRKNIVEKLNMVKKEKFAAILESRLDGDTGEELTTEEQVTLQRAMKKEKRFENRMLTKELNRLGRGKRQWNEQGQGRADQQHTNKEKTETTEVAKFDGYWVKKEAADRLNKLRDRLVKEGVSAEEMSAILQRERRKEERMLKNERKSLCLKCRQPGHMVSACPQLGFSDSDSQLAICYTCGSTEHTSRACNVQNKEAEFSHATCYICGEPGHISRQCPDNPRGLYPNGGNCRGCGSVEHLARDCPDMQEKEEIVKVNRLDGTQVEALDLVPSIQPILSSGKSRLKEVNF